VADLRASGARAQRLFHTARHLRGKQILYRGLRKFQRARPDQSPAPGRRAMPGPWQRPIPGPKTLFADGTACFLSRRHDISGAQTWNHPERAKLWLYNLHYFDDLGHQPPDAFHSSLIERWIAENPAPAGNGWEPYPVSLRVVNWIKWVLNGATPPEHFFHSLAVQVRWLAQHLEWHLLGNHLFANAKALVFAGLFFDGPEAETWLRTGLKILRRELPEQILSDGGHFELSPMYHAIILEDLLDLWALARHAGQADHTDLKGLPERIGSMGQWLLAMCHPDGQIGFFNDAAFGIAPLPADLSRHAQTLGLNAFRDPAPGVTHLDASGYVRVEQNGLTALLDLAQVGPDYIPGHAHADTLSFEMSVGQRRVLVNGGTSTYALGPQREFERSTRAHNTVEVAGQNSSETWAAFRVARRARVSKIEIDDAPDRIRIAASHDGYRRLAGRPVHHREWCFAGPELCVADTVTPATSAQAHFLLAPGIVPRQHSGTGAILQADLAEIAVLDCSAPPEYSPADWHSEFGGATATQRLSIPLTRGKAQIKLTKR